MQKQQMKPELITKERKTKVMTNTQKKTYSKPQLVYESFALSQSIASGCEGIANFGEGACSVTITGSFDSVSIFQDAAYGCQFVPPNPDDYICYHAPSEMNNVFSS